MKLGKCNLVKTLSTKFFLQISFLGLLRRVHSRPPRINCTKLDDFKCKPNRSSCPTKPIWFSFILNTERSIGKFNLWQVKISAQSHVKFAPKRSTTFYIRIPDESKVRFDFHGKLFFGKTWSIFPLMPLREKKIKAILGKMKRQFLCL